MAYTTIDNPELYFQTKIYTGNGSTQSLTFDGDEDMQPDFLWFKVRNASGTHAVFDSVRGTTGSVYRRLLPQDTGAEDTAANTLTAIGTDGFSVGSDGNINGSSETMVAWCWKESATAGFDIVAFTTSGDDEDFSHSLSAVPKIIIMKPRASGSTNWIVTGNFAETTFNNKYLLLNTTAAQGTDGSYSNPTSSQFSTSNNIAPDSTHIAYLWTDIQGYSKFGSYTGNGNADGPFVYTGFKPAWIMTKITSGTDDWQVCDNKRDPDNPVFSQLMPNLADAQNDGDAKVDFLSNGFKIRKSGGSWNGSGSTFIYMAFAEAPFVNSNGVPCNAR